ncbi:MAG: DNA polymerase III subunit beta [Betaproteobacteria bacterium RBG_16_58_11]|nr:MAG: DNA polymerase III subunit beta [Betaproteobacteria bacterium RBG_16_58_11]OFZ94297.1 MAG: DNA polymerase III subunit beta [Betaproteobacteria bacterium RBG_19FT_COMBO_58_11]
MTLTPLESIRTVLVRHPEIRLAILFGSMATGRASRDSDVDLALAMERPLKVDEKMALMAELAEATGRPIDLIDLHAVGEPLLGQIVKRGQRVLGTDERYAELIKRHLFEEADFMPYYRRMLGERRAAWIGK